MMTLTNYPFELTTIQSRMLEILADGMPHTRQELHGCLNDELGALANIKPHIHLIRKKLIPIGETLICEIVHRRICYRHVRLLPSACSGIH